MRKRDLHRERPPPLKILKHSNPNPNHNLHNHPNPNPNLNPNPNPNPNPNHSLNPHPHFRQPVIIHTYSPEIIQADTLNFRQIVQRLTGPGTASDHDLSLPPAFKRARVGFRLPGATTGHMSSGDDHNQSRSASYDRSNQNSSASMAPHPSALGPGPAPLLAPRPLYPNPRTEIGAGPSVATPRDHPHPLLSPSVFDFSPSAIFVSSPSTFGFDYPTPRSFTPLASPKGIIPTPQEPNNPSALGRGILPSPRVPASSLSLTTLRPGLGPGPVGDGLLPRPPWYTVSSPPWYTVSSPLPSPGLGLSHMTSPGFDICDLPILSPAAYGWIEKNPVSANNIVNSRHLYSPGLPPRPPPNTTANFFPSSAPSMPSGDDHHEPLYK